MGWIIEKCQSGLPSTLGDRPSPSTSPNTTLRGPRIRVTTLFGDAQGGRVRSGEPDCLFDVSGRTNLRQKMKEIGNTVTAITALHAMTCSL